MKVAFVGKGGSGKTTLSALFARHLAGTAQAVVAVDADINQHLAIALGMSEDQAFLLPALGEHLPEIKDHLRGGNPRIPSASAMVKTTPPGRGSRLLRPAGPDPIHRRFARPVGGVSLLATGAFNQDDLGVACFHSKVGAVELYLNHLVDRPGEYVVVDMTAGADSFASGLFTRFDLTFIVAEPTRKGVSVYRQYRDYAAEHGVALAAVGNKITGPEDVDFSAGTSATTSWSAWSTPPTSAPRNRAGTHRSTGLNTPTAPHWTSCVPPSTPAPRTGTPSRPRPSPSTSRTPRPGPAPTPARTSPARSTPTSATARPPSRPRPPSADRPTCHTRDKGSTMSLDVSPALLAQAEKGEVNLADFIDTVRASLPYAYRVVEGLSTELGSTTDEFVNDNTTPTDEERAQLLRALASNAIRGSLEEHFGMQLAFVNCHRVAAFRPGAEQTDAYREFTSLHNQIRNQSPELRSC